MNRYFSLFFTNDEALFLQKSFNVINLFQVLILQIISTYNLRYTPIPPFIDPSIKLGLDYSDDILLKKSVNKVNIDFFL